MPLQEFKLKDVQPNPFRHTERYPIRPTMVAKRRKAEQAAKEQKQREAAAIAAGNAARQTEGLLRQAIDTVGSPEAQAHFEKAATLIKKHKLGLRVTTASPQGKRTRTVEKWWRL